MLIKNFPKPNTLKSLLFAVVQSSMITLTNELTVQQIRNNGLYTVYNPTVK